MTKPQFTINTVSKSANFGSFIIEPLPQGFGHTLGNSLRRVLYSSITGSAITSITISGANHQYATIEGVKEDAVQIVLNLKQVAVKSSSDKTIKMTLSAKGAGEVKAGQFETSSGLEIMNPDLVIANITDKNGKLEIEATVESGLGYSPADDRKNSTVGVIPIDAIFSPVSRVNYLVEDTRVGRLTNFDKLILDITTNGTVDPENCLKSAAVTLVEYFQAVVSPQVSSEPTSKPSAAEKTSSSSKQGGSIAIEELDLPTKITNALQKAGFATVSDVLNMPKEELSKIKNLGSKSVEVVEAALKERGFDMV